jgi:hypothetical protein
MFAVLSDGGKSRGGQGGAKGFGDFVASMLVRTFSARLNGQGYESTGLEDTTDFGGDFGGRLPELSDIDGEDEVKRVGVVWQVRGASLAQFDASLADGCGVAGGCLPEHEVGMINARDETAGEARGDAANVYTGTESNLQDMMIGPQIKEG